MEKKNIGDLTLRSLVCKCYCIKMLFTVTGSINAIGEDWFQHAWHPQWIVPR